MTVKELPRIEITKEEKIWLLECWEHLRNHDSINSYKHVKVKTLNSISKDFKPWKIDNQLIRENVEITLKGIIALSQEGEIFNIGNKVFDYIKNELFQDVDKKDFDLDFVADCIIEERRMVRISYQLFSNEGLNLWNGAGSKNDGYGYENIQIGDSSFNTYMDFSSLEEVYISRQKSIQKYQKQQSSSHSDSLLEPVVKENLGIIEGDIFVDPERIIQLQKVGKDKYDLSKLIRKCEELNIVFSTKCYFSVGVLTRAITDHIPPIFNKNSFSEVAGSYGTKSFKDSMIHLDKSSRKIADSFLHTQIRRKETLPTKIQINFSSDLDVLLGEIIRTLS